jgi:short-subunit dehydrogenase
MHCLADYTAAKAGLLATHASLRAELRHSENPAASNIGTVLVVPGQLSTALFGGVKTPSRFLAPLVEPVELAKEIVAMVDSGQSGEIRVPFYAEWIPVVQALPAGLQRIVRSWSGLDRAMVDSLQRRKED